MLNSVTGTVTKLARSEGAHLKAGNNYETEAAGVYRQGRPLDHLRGEYKQHSSEINTPHVLRQRIFTPLADAVSSLVLLYTFGQTA